MCLVSPCSLQNPPPDSSWSPGRCCSEGVMGWPRAAAKDQMTAPSLPGPPQDEGTEQKEHKWENPWVEIYLNKWRKEELQTKQVMERQSLTTSHKQTGAQASLQAMATSPKTSSSQFYCWAWHYTVWNTPLVNPGQLSRLCPLPTPSPPPAHSLRGQSGKREDFDAVQVLLSSSQTTGVLSTLV